MAKRRGQNVFEFTYQSARQHGLGPVEAIRFGSDALTLGICLAAAHVRGAGTDGRWPTQKEYAAEFGMTERNAQREWARFKQVFGEDQDPRDLGRALLGQFPAQITRLAALEKRPTAVLDDVLKAPAELVFPPVAILA